MTVRHLVMGAWLRVPLAVLVLAVFGCGVTRTELDSGGAGEPAFDAGGDAARACDRRAIVVNSDFLSTNVSVVDLSGTVLTESLISSASGSTGLSSPLSGDVVTPTMPLGGGSAVLIDTYPASVLTWVDVATGRVSSQLSVATGFAANPHDYVPVSEHKVYVPRFEQNADPGSEPFDSGSDVLVVDPTGPEIVDSIDMIRWGSGGGFQPRPDRGVRVGRYVYVVLGMFKNSFIEGDSGRLVSIDTETDTVESVLVLEGLKGCTGLARSPAGRQLAVTCLGEFGGDLISDVASSGLAIVDVDGPRLSEAQRFPSDFFGSIPISFFVTFASERRVVLTTYGQQPEPMGRDALIELDTETGDFSVVLEAEGALSLGEVRCVAACGICYAADADRGVLHRFELTSEGRLGPAETIVVDSRTGLPPRTIGLL